MLILFCMIPNPSPTLSI